MKLLTLIIGDYDEPIKAVGGAFRMQEPKGLRFTRSKALLTQIVALTKAEYQWAREEFVDDDSGDTVVRALIVATKDTDQGRLSAFTLALAASGFEIEVVVIRASNSKRTERFEDLVREHLTIIETRLSSEEVIERLKGLRGVSSVLKEAVI